MTVVGFGLARVCCQCIMNERKLETAKANLRFAKSAPLQEVLSKGCQVRTLLPAGTPGIIFRIQPPRDVADSSSFAERPVSRGATGRPCLFLPVGGMFVMTKPFGSPKLTS